MSKYVVRLPIGGPVLAELLKNQEEQPHASPLQGRRETLSRLAMTSQSLLLAKFHAPMGLQ